MVKLVLFFGLLFISSIAAAANSANTVFELIGERLSHMEAVALYKAKHQRAIEDTNREAIVVAKAIANADLIGLDGESTARFFQAQISAAKAIQYRYRAQWMSQPNLEDLKIKDLDNEIRPALIKLGNEISQSIQNFLYSGGQFSNAQYGQFKHQLNIKHLTDQDKELIYEALQAIKPRTQP